MKESVAMHKISDVEVASYLSSGVDSSYLTYLGQVDRTFTVGFDEGKYSEIQDAKEFAASINMKNDAKVITPEEYMGKLTDFVGRRTTAVRSLNNQGVLWRQFQATEEFYQKKTKQSNAKNKE